MHLVNKITIDKRNSYFPMVDFISFKAKQLNKLWDKITYKAYQKGILVVEQEESYTSQACFLNHDFIPVYNKTEKNIKDKAKFTGARKKGLYQTQLINNNIITQFNIHSDVNGSYNILRKLLGQLGVDFKLQPNNTIISRKLLHQLCMPTVLDFKSIDKVLNLKSNNIIKIKALEELDVKEHHIEIIKNFIESIFNSKEIIEVNYIEKELRAITISFSLDNQLKDKSSIKKPKI